MFLVPSLVPNVFTELLLVWTIFALVSFSLCSRRLVTSVISIGFGVNGLLYHDFFHQNGSKMVSNVLTHHIRLLLIGTRHPSSLWTKSDPGALSEIQSQRGARSDEIQSGDSFAYRLRVP